MADSNNDKTEPLITSSDIENIIKDLEKKEKIKKEMEAMKEREATPEKSQESFLTQVERAAQQSQVQPSPQPPQPPEPPPPPAPQPSQPSQQESPPDSISPQPSSPPPPPPPSTPSPILPPPPKNPPASEPPAEFVSPFSANNINKPPQTLPPETKKTGKNPFFAILTFFKYLFLFIFLFGIFYVGLNYDAYKNLGLYLYQHQIKKEPTNNLSSVTLPTVPETSEINLPDSIIIPKINVQAPITWDVETGKELEVLRKSVVHFRGTALPNQTGTTVLTGHSSSYPWAKGDFDQVFTLIYQLNPGDEILIIYQRKKYTYKVDGKKIIDPTDLRILSASEENLNLIACWPIGTSLKRIVVGAKLAESPSGPTENYLPSGQ